MEICTCSGIKLSDSRKNYLLKSEGIKLIRLNNYDLEDDYESIVLYLEDIFKGRANELNIPINEFGD